MSLILDALKRAERERKMGQAPTALEEVAMPPPVARQTPGRRPVILAIVALVIVALAVFAFIRSRHPEAPMPAPAPAETGFVEVIHDPEPTTPSAEVAVATNPADDGQDARIEDGAGIASLDDLTGDPADNAQPDASMAADDTYAAQPAIEAGSTLVTPSSPREPAAVAATKPAVEPPASTSTRTLRLDAKPSTSAATAAAPAPSNVVVSNAVPAPGEALVIPVEEYVPGSAAATTAPAPAVHTAAPPPPSPAPQVQAPSASIRSLKDMPPAYRATFPALAIDVHVYNDNPQRRFVLINGRRYREGEALGEGPRLVQIVPEGVVFDWHNEQVLYGSR